ncbi:hypothetical protein NLU13_4179 [Sarocladium strictum]|uniref:DNA (cytosine-5-)-methyltransferase n=1 Tax=Sarocladium strictum TaxID=5046 RepID=A0AA39L8N6_SARSR|nr:hypothetical protein NLU13_4179 [Sarocladium strictum]
MRKAQKAQVSRQTWPTDVRRWGGPKVREASVASSCTLLGDENDEIIETDLIDLTSDQSDDGNHQILLEGEVAVSHLEVQNESIHIGDCIQVADTMLGKYKVNFVLVKAILRNNRGQKVARGTAFARTRCMHGKLPKKLNELCMILHFSGPSLRAQETPAFIDIPPHSIDGKRALIMTNALYPLHNPKQSTFLGFGDQATRMIAIEEHGTLVCRWKLELHLLSTGRESKVCEEVFSRLLPQEISERMYGADETEIRKAWRGETLRGGSWSPHHRRQSAVQSHTGENQRCRGQQYTLFDSFSCAGGVSRGASLAGFRVQYAVDKSPDVWETYQSNFPGCSLHRGSVDDFFRTVGTRQTKVDVLHLSPPCQPFSPAHTHAAAHDDENMFALMSCFSLLRITRPRIVTLEQTFGISHERHGEYLRTLINDFTSLGFSLRWKIVRLATWGSAQDRKRLVLVASAPGERLPPFPDPSHSDDDSQGLKPFNTIAKVLSQVVVGDDHHDLRGVRHHDPPKAPYPADRLSGTITTSPSGLYFPDGTRDLTVREYAALQGFPKHHTFFGTRTSILRQIGNAFPPNTVRHLYKHIESWLIEQDGMTAYRPRDDEVVDVEIERPRHIQEQRRQSRNDFTPRYEQATAVIGADTIDLDVEMIETTIIDLT